MSETAILSVARAAVATALPGATDQSENPNDVDHNALPAFVVTVERDDAEPAAMGSTDQDVSLTITAEVFLKFKRDESGRELVGTQAEIARAALASDPTLKSLCFFLQKGLFENEIAPGEHRFARATITINASANF